MNQLINYRKKTSINSSTHLKIISAIKTSKGLASDTMFKGYLCYKTILCYKTALDVYLMNFFIWRKNNASFLRYRDFCVFVKPAGFKICDVIISIAA